MGNCLEGASDLGIPASEDTVISHEDAEQQTTWQGKTKRLRQSPLRANARPPTKWLTKFPFRPFRPTPAKQIRVEKLGLDTATILSYPTGGILQFESRKGIRFGRTAGYYNGYLRRRGKPFFIIYHRRP